MPRHSRESLIALGVGDQLPPMTASQMETIEPGDQSALAAETGRRAQSLGKEFESSLEFTHAAWAAKGVACIERLPVDTFSAPKKIQDAAGQYRGMVRILSTRQSFDYRGELASGQSIAMEAKATGTKASSIRIGDRGIRPHQLKRLADGIERFNLVGLIVWNNGGERRVLMPERVLIWNGKYKSGDTKSIPAREFDRYEHKGGIEDYLSPVLEYLEGRP